MPRPPDSPVQRGTGTPDMKNSALLRHAAVIVFALCAATAQAHRVNVFAWTEGEAVEVEAKFNKSGPAKGAKLSVTDRASGKTLAAGATGDTGKWSFRLPADYRAGADGIRITVNAGEGHVAHWDMAPEDLPAGALPQSAAATSAAVAAKTVPAADPAPPAAPAAAGLTREELEAAVAAAVSAQLAPVKRDIAELRNPEPSLRDIIGGLGWIVGLAGAAALGFSRRQRKTDGHKDGTASS